MGFSAERISVHTHRPPLRLHAQLFEACLAPNTLGDGTGCDNMTAVIVRFKAPLYERPALPAIAPATPNLKRSASSPTPSADDDADADQAVKRAKTDVAGTAEIAALDATVETKAATDALAAEADAEPATTEVTQ